MGNKPTSFTLKTYYDDGSSAGDSQKEIQETSEDLFIKSSEIAGVLSSTSSVSVSQHSEEIMALGLWVLRLAWLGLLGESVEVLG